MTTLRLLPAFRFHVLLKGGAAMGLVLGLGCGGSTAAPQASSPGSLKPGTYQLSVALQPSEAITTPIGGLDLTLALPPGVTVATVGAEGRIAPDSLRAGSEVQGSSLVTGTYLPVPNQVRLALFTAPGAPWQGQALVLLIKVAVPVPTQTFQTLNTPPPVCKVVGLDAAGHSTVLLTSQVKPSLSVSTGS